MRPGLVVVSTPVGREDRDVLELSVTNIRRRLACALLLCGCGDDGANSEATDATTGDAVGTTTDGGAGVCHP